MKLKHLIESEINKILLESSPVNDYFLHGTNDDKIRFDHETVFYGTKDRQFANTYGINIYKILFHLKKPFDLSKTTDGKFRDSSGDTIKDNDGYDYSYNYIDNNLRNYLIELGYDGVIMDENIVAFYPNQIKVIGKI